MRRTASGWGVALCVLLWILAVFLPGLSSQAVGRTLTMMSSGTTIVLEGNLARARNVAIANGKRNALEAAVTELISEGVALENYDIINQNVYLQHEYFIDTYRILSETSRENLYEVSLESVVAAEKLKNTLVGLGLIEEDLRSDLSHFQLNVLEVSCSPCFKTLHEYLQDEMEGVEAVSLYAISPGRFTLDIVFRGDIEGFQDALTSTVFGTFRLDPEEMDEEHLRVVMVLIQSEDAVLTESEDS